MPIAVSSPMEYKMVRPLPGLEDYSRFRIETDSSYHPLVFLVAEDDPGIRLTLLDPFLLRSDYGNFLGENCLDGLLECEADPEIAILVVLAPGEHGVGANLAAPLVFHKASGQAVQLLLDQAELPLFAPLCEGVAC